MADVRLIYGERGDARRYRVEALGVYRRDPMPFRPIWVELSAGEIAIAERDASAIEDFCCVNGYAAGLVSGRPSYDVRVESYAAEIALARALGGVRLPLVLGKHGGADVVIDDKRYDVKGPHKFAPELMARHDNPAADRFAVCSTLFFPPFIDARGWVDRAELVRRENIRDPGNRGRPVFVLPQDKLHDFADA